MSTEDASDVFNRQMEDSSERRHENQTTLGTVSISEGLANRIDDLIKLELPAHANLNVPWIFSTNENVLEKMETMTLEVPEKQQAQDRSIQYLTELRSLERRPGAKKINKYRHKLAIYESMEEILEKINKNQVTVVAGEAGCGKTTQVPQYILDEAIKSCEGSMCKILSAVPRRLNAMRAAKQVAEERGVTVGHDSPVGYHIGNNNESGRANASITYCTSGVILRMLLVDPFLTEISHLILDEVQDRDIITDFLLRLMKSLIVKRPSLKLIILCSTIYRKKFVNYFDNCAKVKVADFLYPVEEFYLEDILIRTNFTFTPPCYEDTLTRTLSDLHLSPNPESFPKHIQQALDDPKSDKFNLDIIVTIVTDINHNERDGAILIFLPGVADITTLQRKLHQSFPDLIIPIHGAIINDFQMIKTQQDKIYLATSAVESSLNLDDVAYVIDTGRVKTRLYDDGYTDSLKLEWISLKNVEQRRRKAGKVGPGKCYHVFKESILTEMNRYPVPEILRRNLEEVILRMKVDSLGNAKQFLTKCISPIPEEDVQKSVAKLQTLKILDEAEHLSALGHTILKLSMDTAKGRMIYLGVLFSCLDPVITIAAQLISNPILLESPIRAERCTSDHIALYQLIKQYEEMDDRGKPQFCNLYRMSKYQIVKVLDTKFELANKLRNLHRDIKPKHAKYNVNSKNMNLVRAIVCAGLYPSIAIIRNYNSSTLTDISVTTPEGNSPQFHINSVHAKKTNYPSPLLVYNGIYHSNNIRYLCDSTLVTPLSLILFSGKLSISYENSQIFLNLSQNLRIRCDKKKTAEVLVGLREKLDFIIENEIYKFHDVNWNRDSATIHILRVIVDLIRTEDPGDSFPYVFET